MEIKRKPFQGVFNIVRFNWHFYAIVGVMLIVFFSFKFLLPNKIQLYGSYFLFFTVLATCISLLASFYIYDLSALYKLSWLPNTNHKKLLNINAGFDETSTIILNNFPNTELTVCDFYNPIKHTEVSIKRARIAYPAHPNTIRVSTNRVPFPDHSFNTVSAIFSAHEIRDERERILFFKELARVIKPEGKIYVTEHLRNLNNLFIYNIGYLHFHSKHSWKHTFKEAELNISSEIKTTPFVTTFVLENNGIKP
jgi:ubiquinone/menaquinone biosynthesis C-methylase UbiE